MQIFIKSVPNENGIPEWSIIELQGEVDSKQGDGLAGKLVGDLFYNKEGVPTFIIGHHILQGKVEKLEKPLGVLEKRQGNSGSTEYIVKAIVRRKLCFRERPKPIVGAMLQKSNKTP